MAKKKKNNFLAIIAFHYSVDSSQERRGQSGDKYIFLSGCKTNILVILRTSPTATIKRLQPRDLKHTQSNLFCVSVGIVIYIHLSWERKRKRKLGVAGRDSVSQIKQIYC